MSPYDVLAAWAVKMAARLEQQRAVTAESGSRPCGATFPESRRAGVTTAVASLASRGGDGRTA